MSDIKDNNSRLEELRQLHEEALEEFQSLYARGQENARFLRGRHWTDEEEKEHRDDFRIAYSVPLLATKINRILSEQRDNRFT